MSTLSHSSLNIKMTQFLVVTAILLASIVPETFSMTSVGCPNGCTCNDDTFVVTCDRNRLDVLPITLNPAIQRLIIRNNKIKTVDAAFQFYKDLQFVDLSNNHLVNIPRKSFIYQDKLQELHLANNKLSAVDNKTFLGLRALTVLNLRDNFLEDLPARLFAALSRLEELNLGQNRIAALDPLAFDGLLSLRVLYLDDNSLSAVPTPSFALLPSLAELHVGLNSFTYLPDDAFAPLTKLTVLDVKSAALSNISHHAFKGLTTLRTLSLIDNKLQRVPTAQLQPLTRLEELLLGQNDFTAIGKESFRGLNNLRRLEITGASFLQRVERAAFADNLNLETLTLSSNKQLERIEDGALVGLPNLKHLVLRDNAFRTFTEGMVAWNELRTLDLTDNPVVCDCALLWLTNLIVFKNLTSAQCDTPAKLRDRPLRSLSADDLGCSFTDPRQQAIVVTLAVSAVILVGALGVFLFRYRQKVREALKDYKWNKRAISRKEHEYQKTFSSEDEYAPNALHHQLRQEGGGGLRPIPVTEL